MDLKTDVEMLEYACDNEKDRASTCPASARGKRLEACRVETMAAFAGSYNVPENGKTVVAEVTSGRRRIVLELRWHGQAAAGSGVRDDFFPGRQLYPVRAR